jgi:hypothetical protein
MPSTAVRAREHVTHKPVESDPVPRATAHGTVSGARDESAPSAEFPRHRSVTVHLVDGLDGVVKVAVMLRGRGYRVRDLSVDIHEGVVESVFTCTIALSATDTELLLERLRRLPVVVSAHCR